VQRFGAAAVGLDAVMAACDIIRAERGLEAEKVEALRLTEAAGFLAPRRQPRRTRRRQAPATTNPLTAKEVEAMQLVGEHEGNITAAAKAAGRTRQAMSKSFRKALGKMGKKVMPRPKTQALPTDRRGQIDVPDARATDPADLD
jgi:hypothetical protein